MPNNDFPVFGSTNNSLLKKHLTKEIYYSLNDLKTSSGFTLDQAIKSGVVNDGSNVGIYAGDLESYKIFAPIFDKIIADYHNFSTSDSHTSDLTPPESGWANPDPEGKYIISTRIRVGRNLADMPLGTAISKEQRDEIESKVSAILKGLTGELAGDYYPLAGMSEEDSTRLIEDHFLFKAGDKYLEAAGLNRDWPSGRGIFHNHDKTFLVLINEEDQLRIISMQNGGDIFQVFSRLSKAVAILSDAFSFLYNDHLGFITSCPTNLGTAMRASVHIKLPNLAKNMEIFEKITDEYFLQIRGIHGEHSESEEGIFDISNKRRLGISEVDLLQGLYDGVLALINMDKEAV
ncbi:MAG: arginine kinase [Denitrovibrio sp.]|nr:MAG: arginine kinase [Denitrovibrio sp.]